MLASPYTPLDSAGGQIRLLVLLPADDFSAPIACSLDTAYLDRNPQYEALSYTWGSPGKTHDIALNGVPFTVWENAKAALRRLRYADKPRRLWVDAICINQHDNREKEQQLPLMQGIYPQAERTALSGIGMAKLTLGALQISQMSRKTAVLSGEWGQNINPDYDNIKKMAGTEFADHGAELEWGEVRELLARPWWSRAWIIQEAVLARDLVLICGPDSAPWEAVEKALKKQPRDVRAMRMFGIKLDPNDSMVEEMFRTISHFREERSLNRWNTSIYELLYEFRRQHCANPRDRIYSFLGLASDMANVNVVPRYDQSVSTADAYTDFARTMVRSTGSLAILNCAREWRGISKPQKQAFAYSVFNQSSYHDTFARITDEEGTETKYGWASLPVGWQRVKEGSSCYYSDHKTSAQHRESPLLSLPPPRALATRARRKCPPGWERSHDNLGRVQIIYNPAATDPSADNDGGPEASEMAYLPAWVPNWAGKTHIDPAPLLDWSKATPKHSASGSTLAEVDPKETVNDPLSLTGFMFDEISKLGDPWHPSPDEIPISRRGIPSLERWESLALQTPQQCPYGGPTGRTEALWRTYIADSPGIAATPSTRSYFLECWYDRGDWKPPVPTPDELAAITSHWKLGPAVTNAGSTVKWTTEITQLMMKADKTYNPLKIVKRAVKFGVHGEKEYGGFLKRIHRACAHRRLFVTKKGYIGLAPWNAEVGDAVIILCGGQTPFLLRPDPVESDWWKLVGETFVHGIMGGEAMAGSPELQGFRIC
ncbi:Heterokaryon incompatibility protein (HET) domain containing protein [Rhypophila decipiens]